MNTQNGRRVAVALLAVVMFSVAACGGGGSQGPDAVVKAFFNAASKGDVATAQSYMADGGTAFPSEADNPMAQAMLKLMLGRLTYSLGKVTVDGDKATVQAKVTAPNVGQALAGAMKSVLGSAFSGILSGGQVSEGALNGKMMDAIKAAFSDPNVKTITSNVEIHLVKQDGQWKIRSDQQMAMALMPGMQQFIQQLTHAAAAPSK